jgi:hypothetical protein
MRVKVLIFTLLLIITSLVYGCIAVTSDTRARWEHEERLAEIKAGKMNERDKAEFAEMVAEKVVERLKQQQK